MTKVTGIDLSLTSTGVAVLTSDGGLTTSLVTSTGRTHDTLIQRFKRQNIIAKQLWDLARGSDLVVIEGLFSSGQVGGSQIDRSGLWWRVIGGLLTWKVPVLIVTPNQGKKFLTGHGAADKGTMVRCAGKLWPDWEPSTPKSSEDEADAIALVSVGVAVLDERAIELPEYRREVLAKLRPQVKEIGLR